MMNEKFLTIVVCFKEESRNVRSKVCADFKFTSYFYVDILKVCTILVHLKEQSRENPFSFL